MKSMKKAISLLLALVMCLGMLPMSAFAADVPEHEHNQNGWQCVYTEPVTETDCTHQHDGTCGYAAPTEGSSCTHEHNADCGYAAAVEGVACTCGAQPDENGVVTHTDDCAYVEAKAEVPCKHQHNETCGYVEAKAEVPCTHVCSKESGCVTVVTEGYWTCTAPVAEEVPAEVQAFLDAVAALPAPETVTKDNAEAVGVQVNAVLDMYEGLIDAGLDGREDVAGALNTVYAVYNAVLAAEEIPDGGDYSEAQLPHAEADGTNLKRSAFTDAYNLDQGDTCTGTVVLNGQEVVDWGTPNVWPTGSWEGSVNVTGYNWAQITNSDPNVATVSWSNEGGKLIITFKPGTKSGTTKISVGVDAKYLHYSLGPWNMELNFDYTVTNKGGGGGGTTEPGNKPEKPTVSDTPAANQNGYVYIKCVSYPNSDPRSNYSAYRTHSGFMSLRNSTAGWSFGEVYANDGRFGSDAPAEDYPWLCDLTLDKDWYLYQFNMNYSRTWGTHYLSDSDPVSMTFVSDGDEWYYFTEDVPLVVWITHQKPVEPTYTVTYTDGVVGVTVFPDQGYEGLKAGDATPEFVGTPTRDGYTFMGWSPAVNPVVSADDADDGEIVYTATWQENPDPQITNFAKELVTSATEASQAGLNVSDITYPGNDGKVHIPNGGTVKLLYKITVTGDAGKAYKVTDEGATYVGGDSMEGTIPTGGTAVIYVTKTFGVRDINNNGKLVNTATVTPGKGNESSTSSQETTPAEEDGPVDNGNGIEVTKTRTAINDDATKTTATVGDTITWNITVTNKSNVEKTVTLTELAGVNLSKTSVTLEAGKSETVTATYTVTGSETLAQDGKFYNTVKASTGGTGNKENPEAKDEGTTITTTPVTHTVTVKYLCDENNRPFNDTVTYSYTLAKGEDYDHSVDPNCTMYPNVSGFNSTVKSPISFTLSTGTTWAFDKVLTTDTLKGTMGDEDITINVWYSRDQKGTIGTDPETGDPTDTPDGIPDKYQVKVTFKVENGAWDNETTGDVVKYLVKYASDGTTYAENGTATLGNIIPEVGSKPDRDYKEGYDADNWSQNEPTASTTIGTDTTYTYTYVSDTIVDDGKGISITKTRVSVNGDPNAKAAAPGDEIVWEITVTNNSNVEKTVTLTEKLTSAVLSEKQVTLAAGASKTVTATYTVKSSDNGKTLVNAVVATTDNPDDGKKEAKDPGTPIIDVSKFKVNITKVNDAPNGMHTVPDNPYKLTAKFTVTVKNESGFDLYGLKLTDALTTTIKEKGTDTLVPQGEANKGAVVEFIPNSLTIKDKDGTEHSYNAGEKSQSTVNGRTTREWTILNKDEVFKDGAVMTLVYDVTVESWYPKAITIKLDNWAEYETDDGLPAANTTLLTYNVQAPRYFSLGLDNMFAGTHTGGAGSGTGSGTDGGSSTPETPTEPTQPGGGAGTSTGGEIGGRPDGGGGTEQPDQPDPPVDPNPPVDPVDPDPYEPIIPDEPTPVAPNPPEVEIDDERTPLASANGLNSVDHFAYIIGYDDDTVRPENKITRAEVATIFFRLMTDVYRAANWSTTNDFSDVAAGSWYNNAISTCAKAGLVNGYSDGTFKPDQSITRAEFATIAARFLDEEITGAGAEGFADIEGHWAATNILRAAEAGWVNGDNGRFRPDDYISRAEVMTIVNRMLNRVPDEDHLLPEMKTWSDNPKTAWYYEAVQEATNEHAYEWIDENVENWTELLTIRDWAALEKEWATAYSAGN